MFDQVLNRLFQLILDLCTTSFQFFTLFDSKFFCLIAQNTEIKKNTHYFNATISIFYIIMQHCCRIRQRIRLAHCLEVTQPNSISHNGLWILFAYFILQIISRIKKRLMLQITFFIKCFTKYFLILNLFVQKFF